MALREINCGVLSVYLDRDFFCIERLKETPYSPFAVRTRTLSLVLYKVP